MCFNSYFPRVWTWILVSKSSCSQLWCCCYGCVSISNTNSNFLGSLACLSSFALKAVPQLVPLPYEVIILTRRICLKVTLMQEKKKIKVFCPQLLFLLLHFSSLDLHFLHFYTLWLLPSLNVYIYWCLWAFYKVKTGTFFPLKSPTELIRNNQIS